MNKKVINNFCRKFGFEVHGLGYIQRQQKRSFKENPFEKQREFVKHANVIFDIGANRGDTIEEYVKLFPDAQIYGFEPFAESFNILQTNVKMYQNVKCYKTAIADKPGNQDFFVNKNADTNSLLEPQKTGLRSDILVANKTKIVVEVITIDSFCEAKKISCIDILKMDIQGGELAALKGCEGMLSNQSIKLIYLETLFVRLYKNNPLFHDISKHLEGFNYYLQDLYDPFYGNGSLTCCDSIFLPKSK